jgi:hypothetical protein
MRFEVGHRIAVVKGALQGYYGHVTDHVLSPKDLSLIGIGIRLQGDRYGENNPRFLSGEWFLPVDYLEHID